MGIIITGSAHSGNRATALFLKSQGINQVQGIHFAEGWYKSSRSLSPECEPWSRVFDQLKPNDNTSFLRGHTPPSSIDLNRVRNEGHKIICLLREPKAAVVSHLRAKTGGHEYPALKKKHKLEVFLATKGEMYYTDIFPLVKPLFRWIDVQDDNVLVIWFEHLFKGSTQEKMMKFIGHEYRPYNLYGKGVHFSGRNSRWQEWFNSRSLDLFAERWVETPG